MSAMQRRERPASDVSLLGKKDSAGLAISCGIEQQILHFIQRNACIGEYDRSRGRNLVVSCGRVSQNIRSLSKPASLTSARIRATRNRGGTGAVCGVYLGLQLACTGHSPVRRGDIRPDRRSTRSGSWRSDFSCGCGITKSGRHRVSATDRCAPETPTPGADYLSDRPQGRTED